MYFVYSQRLVTSRIRRGWAVVKVLATFVEDFRDRLQRPVKPEFSLLVGR
jgi:hypothetical protein